MLQQSSDVLARDWSSAERPFALPLTTDPVVPLPTKAQSSEVMKLNTHAMFIL